MTIQAEAKTSVIDIVKLVFSIVFLALGLVVFYYLSEQMLLYRVLMLVGIFSVALFMVMTTEIGRNFRIFIQDAKQEVRKVVWPSRQETTQTALMVFAMVFVVGLILWVLDMALFWGVQILAGQGG